MNNYLKTVLTIAVLACSSGAFAQAADFGETLKQADTKQRENHYFQAFDLYMKAWKQASTPEEKGRANAGIAAWISKQRRYFFNNDETIAMLKKNINSLEGVALFEAGNLIARAYENAGDLKQAWEWQNKRLASQDVSEDALAAVRAHMAELELTAKRYAETVKTHQLVIDDPASSIDRKDEARMRLILAMANYPFKRTEFLQSAEAFLADPDVATEWKAGLSEHLKNVYTRDRDWDKAAACVRRYAELPGLPTGNKARLLLILGDINWRQRHQLPEAIQAFREIGEMSDISVEAKQAAATWLRMLTEEY